MEMSIEFYQSLKWASAAFACGVCLREYAPNGFGKWLGRVGVFVSLFAMTAFGVYSTRECSTLIQLVEQKQEATGIAGKVLMTFVSPAGNKLIIEESEHGVRAVSSELRRTGGTISGVSGESGRSASTFAARAMGANGSSGRSSDSRHVVANVPEWAGWFSAWGNAGNSKRFKFSRETTGQAF